MAERVDFREDVSMQDADAEPITLLYLTLLKSRQRNRPHSVWKNICVVDFQHDDRTRGSKAYKIVITPHVSVANPILVLTIGSDPRLCNMILGPKHASVHCKIYAQLNSSWNIWILEDCSQIGTIIYNAATNSDGFRLSRGSIAVHGLQKITIGPYSF